MTERSDTAPKPQKPYKWLRKGLRRLRYRFEQGLFHAVIGGFRLLGLERASNFGAWLATTIGPRTKLHARTLNRVRRAMPELTPDAADKIVHGVWETIGRTTAEYAHLDQFDLRAEDPRVWVEGYENVQEMIDRGKGAIVVSGHFANWELMPKAMSAYLPSVLVYRGLNNPYVDDWLHDMRLNVLGADELISKKDGGARGIARALRGRKFVAMMIDQKIREGIPAPFFGRPAMTTPAPARLALKFQVPILPAAIERAGVGRYRVTVLPAVEPVDTGDLVADVERITHELNAVLERVVRANPSQWLWLHDRWGGAPKA